MLCCEASGSVMVFKTHKHSDLCTLLTHYVVSMDCIWKMDAAKTTSASGHYNLFLYDHIWMRSCLLVWTVWEHHTHTHTYTHAHTQVGAKIKCPNPLQRLKWTVINKGVYGDWLPTGASGGRQRNCIIFPSRLFFSPVMLMWFQTVQSWNKSA